MKATLTSVTRYTTKKDGSALLTKDGRPYTSLRIKTEEHGDKMLSGFENADTKAWVAGMEVDIEVEQKGEYLNFRVPKAIDKVDEKLETILNGQVAIKLQLNTIIGLLKPKGKEYPSPESEGIDVNDVFAEDEPNY